MSRLLSTSALAMMALASPAFAELTPAQVWDQMVESQTQWGYEVSEGAREEAGDTLTLTDVHLHMVSKVPAPEKAADDVAEDAAGEAAPAPDAAATDAPAADAPATDGAATEAPVADADGDATAAEPATEPAAAPEMVDQTFDVFIPKVVLTQTGDGGVRTVYEGDITAKMAMDDGSDAQPEMDMTFALPGNEMVTTGSPEAMTHSLSYPTIDGKLSFHSPEDGIVPVSLMMTGTKGTYDVKGATGAAQVTTYDMVGDALKVTIDIPAPAEGAASSEGAASGSIVIDATGLATKGTLNTPAGSYDINSDMDEALKAGLTMDGTLSLKTMMLNGDMTSTTPEGQVENNTFKVSGADLSGGFGISSEKITYQTASGKLDAEMTIPGAPMPITYGMDSTKMTFSMPIAMAEAAQPFGFAYALNGVTLGDAIWGMVDPTAQIPRDPMSLNVDVEGDVVVTRNLLDQEAAMKAVAEAENGTAEDPAMPFDLRRLAVKDVSLKAAGADATVTGELTVPEGGTFEAPLGKLTANVSGANTLIDRLAAMGFVPAEQVAGVKMMLMAFAKPVEGQEDAYTTEFEFREGGTIFANGQQVK